MTINNTIFHDSTILLVDDTPENLEVLFEYLSQLGGSVLVAQSGEDALDLIRNTLPDIILLDIMMPGIDGFETCRRLKRDVRLHPIPVIFVSSLDSTTDKLEGFKAGGVDYITKPFRQEEVFARISTHLRLYYLTKELEENNTRLQQEILERKRAEHKAEQANQAKSEFLASMNHELRTPLNGILGYAQILKRDKSLSELQKKGLNIIERSGNHLLYLINGLLDLAKIEAQKMELRPSGFHLSDFLEGLTAMVQIQAQNKHLNFELETSTSLPESVQADEKRLSQILLNLLSNAIKFTEHGTVFLRVLSEKDTADDEADDQSQTWLIRFEVEDTGVGIPNTHQADIFAAFRQLDYHERPREGTGLGLTISRQLVQLMGGELFVSSIVGKGSLFWFELSVPEASPEGMVQEDTGQHIIGFKGEARTVLVVDDHPENRELLVNVLALLGFDVYEAQDGREAIQCALDVHPELIFMDLVMPVLDGFEAIRQIRHLPELAGIKIFAVSASMLISEEDLRTKYGCDDYLQKPINITDLLQKLSQHLRVEWIYDPTASTETPHEPDLTDLVPPPAADVQTLYDTAQDGNFQALQSHIQHLESTYPQSHQFFDILRQLSNQLDEDAICEFLEPYKESNDGKL